MSENKNVIVKHVPEILKDEAVQELFIHYGAIDVKRMNNIGKLV